MWSTGDLKKAFVLETGLEASDMKILFWGDEKDDAEQLQAAGVTDGSSVFLVEEPNNGVDHVEPPPVMTEEIAKAISAVLAVSGEVDELSDRVSFFYLLLLIFLVVLSHFQPHSKIELEFASLVL